MRFPVQKQEICACMYQMAFLPSLENREISMNGPASIQLVRLNVSGRDQWLHEGLFMGGPFLQWIAGNIERVTWKKSHGERKEFSQSQWEREKSDREVNNRCINQVSKAHLSFMLWPREKKSEAINPSIISSHSFVAFFHHFSRLFFRFLCCSSINPGFEKKLGLGIDLNKKKCQYFFLRKLYFPFFACVTCWIREVTILRKL